MKKIDLDKEILGEVPAYMVEQRTLNWYLDRALSNFENMSDRKLAARLDVSPSVINAYRHKRTFPSDEKMMEISRLAQVDPYMALIDLNSWRSEGTAQAAYKEILKRISCIILAMFVSSFVATTPSHASAFVKVEQCNYGKDTVYYGKYYIGFLKRGFVKVFQWLQTILLRGPLTRQYTFAA